MKTTLIPAAGYLRMSSDKQDTSLDAQRAELLTYAAQHGFTIVKWYTDSGISGWKSKQRHAFQKIIADAEEGEFKAILCWDQSRFSRFDPMEANYYWHILRRENVFIQTVKEGRLDFESLGGWLSASVQQHGKNEYCRSLAHDVARGRRKSIAAGNWTTTAPYGYRSKDGRLIFADAEKVETVRRIFKWRALSMGARAICLILNREGIKPPHSAAWNPRTVRMMLERETYIGHMVVGKERTGKFAHVMDEMQVFENMHPPIIDAQLWADVQAVNRRKKAAPKPTRKAHGAALAGLLVCGRCGGPMYGQFKISKYVCSNYHKGDGCSCNQIPYETALHAIAEKIRQVVLMGSVEALTRAIEKELGDRKGKGTEVTLREQTKRQIADIDRKLAGAADRLLDVDPALVATVQAAMNALQQKRVALAATLEETGPKKRPPTAKEIAAAVWELDATLRHGDAAEVQFALSRIIVRIVVDFTPQKMAHSPSGRQRWVPSGGTIETVPDMELNMLRSLRPTNIGRNTPERAVSDARLKCPKAENAAGRRS